MTTRLSRRVLGRIKVFAVLVLLTVSVGIADAFFGGPEDDLDSEESFALQTVFSWTVGSIMLWSFEIFYVPSRRGAALRRMRLVSAIFLKTFIIFMIVLIASAMGELVFRGAMFSTEFIFGPEREFLRVFLVVVVLVIFLQAGLQVVRIVGARNFVNFALGRYRNPIPEERIFMFLDIAGSTALAEKLGDVGVQRLITRFFFDLSEPVAEYGGQIHQYVGDEMVVTWPLLDPKANLRPLACCFAINKMVAEKAPAYQREFGVVPSYRIGLHGGSIVISQCGDQKQEISFYGDTINTTARVVQQCKPYGKALLATGELMRKMDLPDTFHAQLVGTERLRGREQPTDLFSVVPSPAQQRA